ncbi:uncharacterized protein MONBRDRAFT_38875 [Monosiga brevicollis MX1]|uniref:Methyltransferase domain-containing protein n=1 Tax=Monosiga brevicollis TaxID=81824 RepID=A9VAQ4_MONBE|nr:uncharacterized protein MONBRDRAFT_38875 [Monosiga brevicollis MX1]EDQ85414.1 predicted protein [Monosiga brevicollis MX1]|eukprot:XP_001749825.1 hypothetical protein [Monosiga brevicollis MX1]
MRGEMGEEGAGEEVGVDEGGRGVGVLEGVQGEESEAESEVSSVAEPETFEDFDWLREHLLLYDVIFQTDTAKEAAFIEGAAALFCTSRVQGPYDILEPGCGTGRLMLALAEHGHHVAGVDASATALEFCRERLTQHGLTGQLQLGDMAKDEMGNAEYDVAHCMVSSFKYLLTEDEAVRHLELVAAALRPGGLYIIGMHLVDYEYYAEQGERERWRELREGLCIDAKILSSPPCPVTRREEVDTFIEVKADTSPEAPPIPPALSKYQGRRFHCHWQMRTYDLEQLLATLQAVPALQLLSFHDFSYDINVQADARLDSDQLTALLVLQKQA